MFYREEKKTRINRRTDKDPPDAGEAGSRQGRGAFSPVRQINTAWQALTLALPRPVYCQKERVCVEGMKPNHVSKAGGTLEIFSCVQIFQNPPLRISKES